MVLTVNATINSLLQLMNLADGNIHEIYSLSFVSYNAIFYKKLSYCRDSARCPK